VDHLELEAVGVEEEGCVVAGRVVALARLAVDLGARLSRPGGDAVDNLARGGFERDVVQAGRVTVPGLCPSRRPIASPADSR
jgi:hypothetical protein